MSFGLVAYNSKVNDKNLREAAVEVEALSGKARTLAFLKQTPYRLSLVSSRQILLEQPSQESENGGYVTLKSITTQADISFRRWGAKENDWLDFLEKRQEATPIYWYFSPSGLCEPISIRLKEDSNWIVLHMDPLTGRVQEEESYIQ